MTETTHFPPDFIWGAATSAYQIEGAWQADDKGESIWDRFAHTPGNVYGGHTGDTACDHYHRWREDVALMAQLGIPAYRFSINWPRIFPQGTGAINQAGLDFYSQLVDGLLEAGIEPYANLYHWELPQTLQDQGGWPSRSTAEAFCTYAEVLSSHLGDRVRHWITLNEPFVSAYVGYLEGRHAPGHHDIDEMVAASHHLLLAHGWAVETIRANASDAEVTLVLNLHPVHPASPSEADQRAARIRDGAINRWYLDAISGRGYPKDMLAHYGKPMDYIQPGDMDIITAPIDHLGVNYYTRLIARSDEIPESENAPRTIEDPVDVTAMGWEFYPQGLFEVLSRLEAEYTFPALMITENGAAYEDQKNASGQISDPGRIRYLRAHIEEAARALQDGIALKGYFVWSLLDNFEWAHGYSKRFGLIHVDFDTLERTPKESADWYSQVIARNGL
jgi:beta-glucosidase